KTNRFPQRARFSVARADSARIAASSANSPSPRAGRGRFGQARDAAQVSFDFVDAIQEIALGTVKATPAESLAEQIENAARDYQLQMPSYALALRELLPADARINSLRATLHFIDPNIEVPVPLELLEQNVAARA